MKQNKVIIITPEKYFPYEGKHLMALLENSADFIHIRKPLGTLKQTQKLIESIPYQYHNRLILHDHYQLANHYSLAGIHLNNRNPSPPPHYNRQISRSCHTLDEVIQYKNEVDYMFLSPIFNSISKQGYNSTFDIQTLKQKSNESIIDNKVIALGGVSDQNIDIIKQLKFGGIALMGYIWNHSQLKDQTNALKHIIQCYNSLPIVTD